MKQAYVKGSDIRIIGTSERVVATALVNGFDDDDDPVYEGTTEVDWDSQQTNTGADGRPLLVDEDGNVHDYSNVEFRDEED